MNKYQLTVLINEKVSEAGRKEILDTIKKNFTTLIKEDLWGIRSLAYDIKHMNKAYFAYFEFETAPETIITIDKNIRLTEDIIRYLIVRIEDKRVKKAKVKKEDAKKKVESEVKVEIKKEEKAEEAPKKATKTAKVKAGK